MSSNKIQKSIGWSLFSEIAVKFVVPITNMILERVLTQDDFGVVFSTILKMIRIKKTI